MVKCSDKISSKKTKKTKNIGLSKKIPYLFSSLIRCIILLLIDYKLSPKSSLNLATNFCGQSVVGSNLPIKKRNTGGS